jgi:anti-sigma regulatory factor (Ser/Thr protein kinase)
VELPAEFPAVASSLSSVRRAVHACAQDAGASPAAVAAAVLAVNEAATNAIVHGYQGGNREQTVRVGVERDGTWLRFTVGDRGTGLNPRRHSPGVGLGFAIIAQCADELELNEDAEGGIVVTIGIRMDG